MQKPYAGGFLKGAAILSAATVIVKIIGAMFKIPLFNILDDTAVGFFNQAYNVFAVLLIVGTAGLPAVAKMVSSALVRGYGIRNIRRVAWHFFLWFGLLAAIALAAAAPVVARWSSSSEWAIRAIAPAVFFVCLMCPYRGLHQGYGNMLPTAFSQVVEAGGKMVLGLLFAFITMEVFGAGADIAASAALMGVTAGSMLGVAFLMLTWKKNTRSYATGNNSHEESRRGILKEMLRLAAPPTLAAALLAFATLIDISILLQRLQTTFAVTVAGANEMYAPLAKTQSIIGLPQAFIVALAVSLVPALSAAAAKRNQGRCIQVIETSMRVTALLALPAAAGLIVLGPPVMGFLFPRELSENAVGGMLLSVQGISVVPLCLVALTNAMLQSLGKVNQMLCNMALGAAARVITTNALFGTMGLPAAAVSPAACYGLITVLNIAVLARSFPLKHLLVPFVRPLLASACMGVAVSFLYRYANDEIFAAISSLLSGSAGRTAMLANAAVLALCILAGFIVYIVFLTVFGGKRDFDALRKR
jgi:stage V sporulation protein B